MTKCNCDDMSPLPVISWPKMADNAWRHSLAIGWLNFNDHRTKENGASSYTVKTGVTCHLNQESPDFGPWGTLAYINARRRERLSHRQ